jgi:hypothetical protein
MGGQAGSRAVTSIDGWNLRSGRLPLDTERGSDAIRETALRRGRQPSNVVTYAVDTIPECQEAEPNDAPGTGQRIGVPQTVNGRIGRPGDVDLFLFEGRAGDDVVAEVVARRLRSPLDSLLRLTDDTGRVLAWNDDFEDPEAGLLTHHADSYLRARLPDDGVYYVRVVDAQGQGGDAFGYRLRVGSPRPDFALRVTPASVNVRAGSSVPLCVHAVRKDGFSGDVELELKDAPEGFVLSGGRLPAARDRIRVTLTVSGKPIDGPVELALEGRAVIDGETVVRSVVPAEDMMQAFLYRHLVPSEALVVAVLRGRRGPPAELADDMPVQVPAGGSATVRIRTPTRRALRNVQLELFEAPEGVVLEDVTLAPEGLSFAVKADGEAAVVGFEDNLIVNAYTERPAGRQGEGAAKRKRRVFLGVLPAIPIEIVSPGVSRANPPLTN